MLHFQHQNNFLNGVLRKMVVYCSSTDMSEPNRPIEVRWLSADVLNNEFENRLMQRCNLLPCKSTILLCKLSLTILIFFRSYFWYL